MSSNNKGKKTALKVIGIIFLIIMIVVGIFAYRYRSHIKAAVIWLTTSDEDIQKNIETAKNQQTEVLNSSGFYANAEADAALVSGEITAEQHTQILLGNITLEEIREQSGENTQDDNSQNTETTDEVQNDNENDSEKQEDVNNDPDKVPDDKADASVTEQTKQPASESTADEKVETPPISSKPESPDKTDSTQTPAPPVQTQTPTETQPAVQTSEADKQIAEIVTKMYVLKAEYTASVEGVVASMKADYSKLPAEQRTRSAKQSIAASYMSKINAMEAQCDAQVNAIVSQLKQILKANGRDMSLAEAILSTYATEKENTKAYYLSTYGD